MNRKLLAVILAWAVTIPAARADDDDAGEEQQGDRRGDLRLARQRAASAALTCKSTDFPSAIARHVCLSLSRLEAVLCRAS
jgi:hypothetical protein